MNVTTMEPIADAVAAIERQALRAIGVFQGADGAVDYPIGWEDADRDAVWMREILSSAGISQGDFVVLVSAGHEAPWYQSVLDAVYALEATVCPLEPARFEIGRAEMFFRRFPISSIIGLDAELAAALDDAIGLAGLLAGKRQVLVRPGAIEIARAAGASFGVIAPVGPAIGVAASSTDALEINGDEWMLEEQGGRLCISTVAPRALSAKAQPLATTLRYAGRSRARLAQSAPAA